MTVEECLKRIEYRNFLGSSSIDYGGVPDSTAFHGVGLPFLFLPLFRLDFRHFSLSRSGFCLYNQSSYEETAG